MALGIVKVLIASIVISFTSWLAGKKPGLAGLIIALPISSMIALVFSYGQHRSPEQSVTFAKSIFFAIPVSMLFFVPFLFADRLKLSFPMLYALGVVTLTAGYLLHRRFFGS